MDELLGRRSHIAPPRVEITITMEIVWRSIALEDLDEARRYIMQDDPQAAERVRTAILSAIERLAEAPHLGKPGRVDGTRERVIPDTPYVAAYTVLGDQVNILSIIHGARRWPEHF
jgi:toxin ParE1/3/4